MLNLLTKGVIPALVRGDTPEEPVLQIIQLRSIPGTGQERYRLLVSDGVYSSSFAMLATQLNSKIFNKEIEPFCIIKLNRFICNTVQNNKKVLIILDLSVVQSAGAVGQQLGNPTQYDPNKTPPTPANTASPAPSKPSNQSNGGRTPLVQRNLPNSIMGSGTQSPRSGSYNAVPLSSLSPYSNKWTICVRVTSKSAIKTWSNSRGEGKLFSMNLLDESGEIRATAFKDQVDMFYEMIEIDKVYYISSATIKTANKQFSNVKNDYELSFNHSTTVNLCNDDASNVPTIQFEFVSFDQLETLPKDSIIDMIGVCKETAELGTVTIRSSGKELKKREVQMVDQTGRQVSMTLWGADAENFEGTTQPVIAAKGVRLSDFGGRSLSLLSNSTMQLNPDIPEAHQLKGWFESEGKNVDTVKLSNASTNVGVAGVFKSFKEVENENLGMNGEPAYYSAKACVSLIRKENCMYKACPTEKCNKKVVDQTGGQYRCEKCNMEFDTFNYRLMLTACVLDYSLQTWITMFQDQAEAILGTTAQEMGSLRDNNPDMFDNVFLDATFKEYLFKLRVKSETYNDETRLKTTVVAVAPLNARDYNQRLIKEIKEMAES